MPSGIDQIALLGIRPRKGLGQNYLIDEQHQARIVAAAGLMTKDVVLEIGPGPAVLTDRIARQAGRVVGVELDDRLIEWLQARFAAQPHVEILHGDILKMDVGALMRERLAPGQGYKVIANLPYYITGATIPHLLEADPSPEVTILTLQKEVAERICAAPPEMSLLALGAQLYCEVSIAAIIPAGAFRPRPNVDSAVVRFVRHSEPLLPDVPSKVFFRQARAGFSQRRKQLRNSLAAGLNIPAAEAEARLRTAGIDPQRRAETLTVLEWGSLARVELAMAAGPS
jgi:16S rRNA (adenine1518-N6/adenine1519-N6)-dimethyltransferase